MSADVDVTRSFAWGRGGTILTSLWNEEKFKGFVPGFVYEAEKHKIPGDDRLLIKIIDVDLVVPTSHPSLAHRAVNQTIEDLRLYMALLSGGRVYDVVEPPLYRPLSRVSSRLYPQVVRQPTIINGHPHYQFSVTFIPEHSWHMWVGEPGPLDHDPRHQPGAVPLPSPVPPTWDYPTQQPPLPSSATTTTAPADDL